MNSPVANQPRPPEKPPAPTRFAFATGDRPLLGYTIKRGVGRGGFGEVYFAVSDGGKEVALKLIRRNLDVELRGVQHCLNLKHPNLLVLYDVRRDGDDDDCWIVMEYVAGESLEGTIRRHPHGMPADEAVDWLRGIAAGASYLHSHGVVHRDLKPGNVFRDDSVVKLGDYGLSKFISCSRRSGQTESVGTVHYMAPEISHGRYGREIDIYALGIILYEMLTGRVPFDGESVGEVLMKHLTAEPDVSAVPAPYRQVVARALAKDPTVRFATVEQFLAALPGGGQTATVSGPAAPPAAEAEFYHSRDSAASPAESLDRQPAAEPAPRNSQRWKQRTKSSGLAQKTGLPPSVFWSLFAVVAYIILRSESGPPYAVKAIALLIAGLAVGSTPARLSFFYASADRRLRQLFGKQHRVSSEVPAPRAPMPVRRAQDSAGVSRQSGFPSGVSKASRSSRQSSARAMSALANKSRRERCVELLESLLFSAAVAVVSSIIAVAWQRGDSGKEAGAWFAITGTLGAWGILALSKLWEGKKGEQILRRSATMVVGLGVGAASFGLERLLMVQLPFQQPMRPAPWHVNWSFYNHLDGAPHFEAYLVYFGLLFFVVPFWRQANRFRRSRVKIGSLALTLTVAMLLNLICPFPQPWGAIVAGIVSLSVQVATPLVTKTNRFAT